MWMADGSIEIHLGHDLDKVQRRVTLAHEIHHVLRGRPCRPLCPDDEEDVREDTARWFMPDPAMVGHVLATRTIVQAAEHLEITPDVLFDRVDSFTDDELEIYSEAFSADLPIQGQAGCNDRATAVPRRQRRSRIHDCRSESVSA